MALSQRQKGIRGERKAVEMLRKIFPDACRSASQFRAGHNRADLDNTGVFHVEVKHGKKPNVRAALAQCQSDKLDNKLGVVIIFDDRQPPFVVMSGDDFLRLLESMVQNGS